MAMWLRHLLVLDSVYITRLLGMFLLFPVFSVYARDLQHATPLSIGVALGVYGLSQSVLQIPFGIASDRWGRKRLLLLGLFLFFLGSLLAAQAETIEMMIAARFLQGMGAVSGVILAYLTDLMPPEKLSLAMSVIGASIGLSFLAALVLAPVLHALWGMSGMFYIMALLAGSACLLCLRLPHLPTRHAVTPKEALHCGRNVVIACATVFVLHFVFTGSFVILPQLLHQHQATVNTALWLLYLPSNLIALMFMRRKRFQPHPLSFGLDYLGFALALFSLSMVQTYWGFLAACSVFFIAFYRLETGLPHYVAQGSEGAARGQIMAYFTSSQFMGSFLGGACAGLFWHLFHLKMVLMLLAGLTAVSALCLFYIGKKDVG